MAFNLFSFNTTRHTNDHWLRIQLVFYRVDLKKNITLHVPQIGEKCSIEKVNEGNKPVFCVRCAVLPFAKHHVLANITQ
jgi:hypothetical protein